MDKYLGQQIRVVRKARNRNKRTSPDISNEIMANGVSYGHDRAIGYFALASLKEGPGQESIEVLRGKGEGLSAGGAPVINRN